MILFEEKMKHYSVVVALIGISTLLIFLLTPLQSYSLGFFIGLTFGFINLWTIYYKTKIVGRAANVKNKSAFSFIWAGSGFVVRTAIALCAVWLAIAYPAYIHLLSVITGFSLIYIILLIDMIIQFIRKR
ncbi:ATP synthase subunit I [Halalkalibacter oceani]|uniref:ATP synthase subunit I n=1 Tax=Halalkalibacter oceani TaxID=1653776 RepID=A0A9X2IPB6_9BACI|nr:ATP synthase subunit I [Halalkalibacter oceani]MCM3714277.1 ATP synthase subunit I [Halalkalibacter oceani]